jgi:hypothetical protein
MDDMDDMDDLNAVFMNGTNYLLEVYEIHVNIVRYPV